MIISTIVFRAIDTILVYSWDWRNKYLCAI